MVARNGDALFAGQGHRAVLTRSATGFPGTTLARKVFQPCTVR